MSAPTRHPSSVERTVAISRPDLLRIAVAGLNASPASRAAVGRLIQAWSAAAATERLIRVDGAELDVEERLAELVGVEPGFANVVPLFPGAS